MQSIRKKLSIYIVAFSVISILLSAVLVNMTVNNEFSKYVADNQEKRNQRIVEYFKEVYKRDGKWTKDSGVELMHEAYMSNYCLALLDQNKRIVWTMNPEDIRAKIHFHMMEGQNKGIYKTYDFPIHINGEVVGYASIGQYSSILLSEEDVNFKISINKSMAASIVITILITIFISVIISKQFSIPIKEISDISVRMSEGNYEVRSERKSDIEEIENLRLSINDLGEKLKYQDLLRKRLIADITHEIRTPLNVFQNNLEAMIDGVYEISKERLVALNSEVVRFGKLLNDLNILKEYDAVEIKIKKERISLKDVAESVIKDFSIEAKAKNINLVLKDDKKGKYIILGDYDKLKQVFINLLSNAIKFTHYSGKIEIEFKEDRNFIVVCVSDNGIGIREKDLPFVFERLYKGNRNGKDNGKGIGLTIVKRILSLHGVYIDVESKENIGTKFTMHFRKA
ncbi:sensor histidine kinase [Fervidicella metallireducens AeB]|uniref:histidine kinase n=1 Tax=Fervidicella metallireducens AeB TaxID=1403537 RepID=A0A017RY48_9CLOT|nr:HAMP domain-containing sensor histidine kinase [Fervidicella metallireducens]EYE88870.1 sensor histidine kinase [Fervidicella metallireducens AeB]